MDGHVPAYMADAVDPVPASAWRYLNPCHICCACWSKYWSGILMRFLEWPFMLLNWMIFMDVCWGGYNCLRCCKDADDSTQPPADDCWPALLPQGGFCLFFPPSTLYAIYLSVLSRLIRGGYPEEMQQGTDQWGYGEDADGRGGYRPILMRTDEEAGYGGVD